jgi:hypothetical protein
MPTQRIFISRTEREWNVIEKKLKEEGRKDFNAYLRGKIYLLQKQYEDCPSCVCTSVSKRIQKPYYLPESCIKVLMRISVKTNVPLSTIVDRLIVDPLILAK